MTESLVDKFYGIVDGYYSGSRDFVLVEEALKEYENRKHINKGQLRAAYEAGFEYAKILFITEDDNGFVDDDGFDEWYNREIANLPEGWDDHHD